MMFERYTVPLSQLVPPDEPLRVEMGDEAMSELVLSIREIGVLFPLLVRLYGDGEVVRAAYADVNALASLVRAGHALQVIDGHRRMIACEKGGVQLVPVTVTDADHDTLHTMMLHANIMREDVTAAEEGWQFLELSNKHQWSMDRLMRVFRRSEDYINTRVELVQKDPAVAAAVHTRVLNLAQARELLREKDPERRRTRMLLAIEHGYNARELKVMRQNLESERVSLQGNLVPHTPPDSVAPAPVEHPTCVWCDQGEDPENLRIIQVHWYHLKELMAVVNQVGARNLLGSTPTQEKES